MRSIIHSIQIDDYFNSTRRDAQELLPHLVRKLLFATLDLESLKLCRIPVGDDIGRPGYDGRVETLIGTNFVPIGPSVWEMGTGDPKKKAEEDYGKRTSNPGNVDPSITTFVFVTPHRWTDKDKWVQGKQKQGKWENIRVLDNVDLESWLDTAPVVARWFARQIGIPVDSFRDIDLFLDEFCTQYGGIRIPEELIISGRNNASNKLADWIKSDSSEIFVQGEAAEEAAAFVAATIKTLPDEQGPQISAKTLFVDKVNAIDFLASSRSQHFIVPLNPEVYKRLKSIELHNVRLIVPLTQLQGYLTKDKTNTLKLGLISRRDSHDILTKLGISSGKADRITSESKGSLLALLLLLGGWQDEPLPWMTGEAAFDLVPLMLVGQWSVENQNDHKIVEELSDKKYKDIEQIIAKWKTPAGPLIRRYHIWDWLAWDFAWDHLASEINKDQINRFEKVAKSVLAKPDPRFELSPDKRWMASVYKKVHPYSKELRSGLIGSVVQLAIHNDMVLNGSGQSFADSVVNSLLIGQNDTFPTETWLSISSWLPDLAEASPDVFLQACEKLVKSKAAIEKLFEEGGDIFSSSEHTYLLWALERLAWSTEFLTRVALILGELSALDPGGKLHNRPINSLKEIFLPWHPHTTASVQHRLDAIDVLYREKPDITWKLACSLLPNVHDVSMETNEPRWRDWKTGDSAKTTIEEYWTFIRELVTRMIEWAGNSGERWATLISLYNTLRRQYQELGNQLFTSITKLKPESFDEESKIAFSEKLREISTRHRQFKDSEWSLKEDDLLKFDELYEKFKPNNIIQQYTWLFASWPEIPISMDISYEKRQRYIDTKRLEALRVILKEKGIEGLFLLAEKVESPSAVGFIASKVNLENVDELTFLKKILSCPVESEEKAAFRQMGYGFVLGSYQQAGPEWVEKIISESTIEWDDLKFANLALGLPADSKTWDRINKWGNKISKTYWQNVGVHSISPFEKDTEYAIAQLFEAGRPYAALNLASFSIRSAKRKEDKTTIPETLIIKLLEETPKYDPRKEKDVAFNSLAYEISELLDILEAKGTEVGKLVQLEWSWMPALEHSRRGLKALQQALNSEPKLFVDILKLVYRSKNEKPHENPSEQEKAQAEQAFRLLEEWKVPPGFLQESDKGEKKKIRDGDISFPMGKIDGEKLFTWVDKARELANSCQRLDICDGRIGNVLAYSPYDSKGHWPCEEVCDLIEKLSSEKLERGIELGVYNKRGVHASAKGGAQERELVLKFQEYAQKVSSKYPRTAAMLGRIAKGYEHEAQWHDEQDEFEEFE